MSPTAARALIVEDDRSWQQILSEILSDAGLTIDVAENLEQAVVCLRSAPHRLALIDLSLTGGDPLNQDGLCVLDAVRHYDPGCVTIMLTGYATVELAVSVLADHGAFTCLRKEAFDRAAFRELVRHALASAPPPEAPARAGEPPPGGTGSAVEEVRPGLALVVEDDAGWRSILAELLTDAGYEVRLCSSYGEALGCLRRQALALAVVDLSLAGTGVRGVGLWDQNPPEGELDGYRLLASTRGRGIPTIVVSGVGTPDDIERAYAEQGIFAYLEKQTFDRRTFLQAVEEGHAAYRTPRALDALTDREREVLELLARGMTNKEIAEVLVITTNTVKRHLKAIFEKLDVHTRSAAAAKAVSAGVPAEWPEDEA